MCEDSSSEIRERRRWTLIAVIVAIVSAILCIGLYMIETPNSRIVTPGPIGSTSTEISALDRAAGYP